MWNTKRGFLVNYPNDVVALINGRPITKADILNGKRQRQQRMLSAKRRVDCIVRPCFVWTFYVDGFPYGGWHLYIKTLKNKWWIRQDSWQPYVVDVMRLFPCGYLPMIENFSQWKAAFAEMYHYPTMKRPNNQGLAIAWAEVENGHRLLNVMRERPSCPTLGAGDGRDQGYLK